MYCCCFTFFKPSIYTGFQITWGLSENYFLFLDQKPPSKYNQEKCFNAYQKSFYFLMTAETMEGILQNTEFQEPILWVNGKKDTVEVRVILERTGCTEKACLDCTP